MPGEVPTHNTPWGWYVQRLWDGSVYRYVVFSPTGSPLSDHPTWWTAMTDALARRPLLPAEGGAQSPTDGESSNSGGSLRDE